MIHGRAVIQCVVIKQAERYLSLEEFASCLCVSVCIYICAVCAIFHFTNSPTKLKNNYYYSGTKISFCKPKSADLFYTSVRFNLLFLSDQYRYFCVHFQFAQG